MERDHPIVEGLDRTGLPPWDTGKEPVCPICFEGCDVLYFDRNNDVVGCDNCVTARDAWELMFDEQ